MTDPLGQSQVIPYLQIMADQGFQITLLSAEKKDRYETGHTVVEKILSESGIKWEPVFFTSRPPIISKIYDQWQLNRKAEMLHRREHFDFVHCRSYVPAATALKLKNKFGVPFLFDMRGFWVDERVDNGQWDLGNPFYKRLYNAYKKKEKKYLKEARYVITLTEKGKKELLSTYHVPDEKISVIPCCADLSHFDFNKISLENKAIARNELGIPPGVKVLGYLGSLGGWYLADEMLDFFTALKQVDQNALFLFITHNKKEDIMKYALPKGVSEKSILVKAASRKEVPLYLSLCDWSVFFIKDAYSKKASSPTKQGEIMSMGIPVVCNDIGDTGLITETSGSGIVVKEFNQKSYRAAAEWLETQNGNERERIRQAAFTYFDLAQGGKSYLAIYRKMLAE